jgi:hypothetical protein
MEKLNIYQRINAVMKDENIYLKKGSAGQGTGAQYDELIAILAPKLTEHGIVITVDKYGESRNRDTKKGSYIYESDFKVSYINIDQPEDRIETIVEAHAQDGGDKAPGKANTYAAKTSMLKVFGIETGDNEESRSETIENEKPVSAEQAETLKQLLKETDSDVKAFCSNFGCSSVDSMLAISFVRATAMINAKKKGM